MTETWHVHMVVISKHSIRFIVLLKATGCADLPFVLEAGLNKSFKSHKSYVGQCGLDDCSD